MVDIYEIRDLIDKLEDLEESLSCSQFQYDECDNDDYEQDITKEECEVKALKDKINKKMRKYLSKNW